MDKQEQEKELVQFVKGMNHGPSRGEKISIALLYILFGLHVILIGLLLYAEFALLSQMRVAVPSTIHLFIWGLIVVAGLASGYFYRTARNAHRSMVRDQQIPRNEWGLTPIQQEYVDGQMAHVAREEAKEAAKKPKP